MSEKKHGNWFKFVRNDGGSPQYTQMAGFGNVPSYWSYCRGEPIDHIMASGCARIAGGSAGGICKQKMVGGADHFPIWAKIKCGEGVAAAPPAGVPAAPAAGGGSSSSGDGGGGSSSGGGGGGSSSGGGGGGSSSGGGGDGGGSSSGGSGGGAGSGGGQVRWDGGGGGVRKGRLGVPVPRDFASEKVFLFLGYWIVNLDSFLTDGFFSDQPNPNIQIVCRVRRVSQRSKGIQIHVRNSITIQLGWGPIVTLLYQPPPQHRKKSASPANHPCVPPPRPTHAFPFLILRSSTTFFPCPFLSPDCYSMYLGSFPVDCCSVLVLPNR